MVNYQRAPTASVRRIPRADSRIHASPRTAVKLARFLPCGRYARPFTPRP